ncbi:MAG TPA: FtsX-like permease family protein [Actinomycetales bacterium]
MTLRGVRGHLLRFILTTASVMLGVAFVAGTFVLTDSLQSTFDRIAGAVTVGTDVVVRGDVRGQGGQGAPDVRQPLPVALVDDIAEVPGVRNAYATLQGNAILVGEDGTAVRNAGAPTFGFDYRVDDPALPLVDGRGPTTSSEVAVEETTLEKSGLKLGDSTRLVVEGTVQPVTVVGVVRFSGGAAGATIVAVDRASALRWFAADGTIQEITVQAEPGTSQEQLRTAVAAVLPTGVQSLTGEVYSAEAREEFASGLGFVNTFLLVFAGISLFVGAFIIANTFAMLVAQRTRELALLRAIGASRRQVVRVVLGEAAVVGLAGGVLGLAAGVALAAGLQALIATFGLEITGGLPVQTRTVVVSLTIGLVVTLASAVLPALRAGRIAPVAAMRDDVAMPERSLRLRTVLGAALVAVGAAAMIAAAVQLDGSQAGIVLGVGAAAAFFGLVVAAPVLARPVVLVLAAPLMLVSRTIGRLSRDNTLRNPRRTATTAISLMIGLALVSAVSVLASSTTASVDDLIDDQFSADFILTGGNAPFPVSIADRAGDLPGVGTVVDSAFVPVVLGTAAAAPQGSEAAAAGSVNAAAVVGSELLDAVALEVTGGDLTAVDRGELAVSSSLATEQGLQVGDEVQARVGIRDVATFSVGAVYEDSQAFASPLLVPRALYESAVPSAYRTTFSALISVEPGADPAAVRRELTELVKPQLVLSVQDREEFKESQAAQINQLLAIIYVLLALSVVIAALGIVNTLALSVFERTREIGLLRAVGMTRNQLRTTITFESVITALFGAVLGTVLGLSLGILLQRVLSDQGLAELSVPWAQVALTFALAGVVGVVAALLPAWRASRLDVLRAVSSD